MSGLTIAEMVDAGREMNRCRDEITAILTKARLSNFHVIAMMDMMTFELKTGLL